MTNTTAEYWWIPWTSGPRENSVALSWMGMFVIPKYSSWRWSFAHLPITSGEKIEQKTKTNSTFSVLLAVFPKDLLNNSRANSDSFCGRRRRANWIIALIWPQERNEQKLPEAWRWKTENVKDVLLWVSCHSDNILNQFALFRHWKSTVAFK